MILRWGRYLTGRTTYGKSGAGKYSQHVNGTQAVAVDNLPGKRHRKPPQDWLISEPEIFEPIISQETWDKVQIEMAQRKLGPRPARRATAVLTGLLVCECGSRMTANFVNNTQYYQCTRYLTQGGNDRVLGIISEHVESIIPGVSFPV